MNLSETAFIVEKNNQDTYSKGQNIPVSLIYVPPPPPLTKTHEVVDNSFTLNSTTQGGDGKVHKMHDSDRAEHILAKSNFPAPQISKSSYWLQIVDGLPYRNNAVDPHTF